MDQMLKKLPIEQRYHLIREVFNALNQNTSQCAKVLSISRNTVYNALSNPNPTSIQHERKLKEEHKLYIHARTIEDPYITGDKLSHEIYEFFGITVTKRTINRYRVEMGLRYRPPFRSANITPTAAQKRFEFTKFHIENLTNFKNIVFTDESWFELGRNSRWVWVDKKNITNKVLSNTKSHPQKIMIWGGIGFSFKTDLIFIEGNINSETYIEQIIFGSNLIEAADKRFGIGNWKLMQDNARPHVSFETLAVLKELEIDLLPDWPPYSPDLNIIEVKWAIMERRVEIHQPKTIDDLKIIISKVWEELTWQTINGLVNGIPNRLRAVNNNPSQTLNFYSSKTEQDE